MEEPVAFFCRPNGQPNEEVKLKTLEGVEEGFNLQQLRCFIGLLKESGCRFLFPEDCWKEFEEIQNYTWKGKVVGYTMRNQEEFCLAYCKGNKYLWLLPDKSDFSYATLSNMAKKAIRNVEQSTNNKKRGIMRAKNGMMPVKGSEEGLSKLQMWRFLQLLGEDRSIHLPKKIEGRLIQLIASPEGKNSIVHTTQRKKHRIQVSYMNGYFYVLVGSDHSYRFYRKLNKIMDKAKIG